MIEKRRIFQIIPQQNGAHLAVCTDGAIFELARVHRVGIGEELCWKELPPVPQPETVKFVTRMAEA